MKGLGRRRECNLLRRLVGSSLTAVLLAFAPIASAEEPATVSLTYSAPESCPPMVMFLNQLRERNPSIEFGSAGHGGFEIVVDITRTRTENQAKITITGPHATRTTDHVTRQTCGEVVTALVPIATRVLSRSSASDSSALGRSPASASNASASAAPTSNASASAAPASAAPAPAAPTSAFRAATRGRQAALPPAPSPAGAASRDETWFGIDGALTMAGSGALGVGASVYVGHSYAGKYPPSWRFGFHASTASVSVPADSFTTSARATWIAVQGSLSPARLHLGLLELVPSVQAEGGGLTVEPAPELAANASERGPWFAAGASVRLEWSVSPWCALGLQGEALVPFTRSPFVLGNPSVTVYQAPNVVVRTALGARFVFL